MSAIITRLRPPKGSYVDGLAAFRAASLRVCLTSLHGVDDRFAAPLRARALLRLGDPAAALAAIPEPLESSWRQRSEFAMLLSVALSRLGRTDAADLARVDARVFSVSAGDHVLEAEVEYYEALDAFGAGDRDRAEAACRRGFRETDATSLGPIPMPHVVSRLQELLGLIEASKGQYHQQLNHARAAIATLDAHDVKDVWQEAFAVANLSNLARDFDLEDDTRFIIDRVNDLKWTPDLAATKFRTLECLAWTAMLRGEEFDTLRMFRRAAAIASTIPQQIYIAVDRAIHARSLGRIAVSNEEVDHALKLSESYNWEESPGDSRFALLPLAQAAIFTSPARARAAYQRYVSIHSAMPANYVSRLETRVRAEESYTDGVILRAEGNILRSTDRLQSAFHMWSGIGYAWRAARAALELSEMDAGEFFRLAVRNELRTRPDSVFAHRARLAA